MYSEIIWVSDYRRWKARTDRFRDARRVSRKLGGDGGGREIFWTGREKNRARNDEKDGNKRRTVVWKFNQSTNGGVHNRVDINIRAIQINIVSTNDNLSLSLFGISAAIRFIPYIEFEQYTSRPRSRKFGMFLKNTSDGKKEDEESRGGNENDG